MASTAACLARKQPPLARPPWKGADRHSTLTEALLAATQSDNGVTLVGDEDREEFRSYAELYQSARRRAAGLRARGLQRGERVVIVLNTSFEFIEVFFGVMLAGGVPVPAYPPLAMSRMDTYKQLLAHITNVTGTRFLVTDHLIGATLGTIYESCETLEEMIKVSRLDGDPEQWGTVEPSPEDAGFIQCSSGSTSAPKAVVLSHATLMANLHGIAHAFELTDEDAAVSWLPLYHDMGLIGGLLSCVAQAIPMVLLPPNLFIMDTAAWWRAISRHRATITAGPNFAYGLSIRRLDNDDLAQLDLSCLRIALCGAEPVQSDQVQRFTKHMTPAGLDPRAFYPAYGLAESCVAVTTPIPLEGLRVDRVSRAGLSDGSSPQAIPAVGKGSVECVSLGRAIPGTTVRIAGPDGEDLPDRHVGEVRVKGPSVMSGYYNDPAATAAAFCDGELLTGDLGYLVRGELHIVGRIKNMLIVRGRNYYAEDIEFAVEQVPGVRKGNAVAYGEYDERRGMDRLHIAVETRLRTPEERAGLEANIREAVSEAVGLLPDEVLTLRPGSLPKTTSGKKQRLKCRDNVASGAIHRKRQGEAAATVGVILRSQMAVVWHLMKRDLTHRHR